MRILAERMTIHPVSKYQFQVLGGGIKEGLIDIRNKNCSCKVFQLDSLVYTHVIVACLTVRVNYISICFDFYTKNSLVMAYAQPVESVGDVADWDVPE